jgi:hypothetical protein
MSDETSNRSGGVDLSSGQTDIGGDVTGRDKIEQRESHTVFDQRGQHVDKQTNVAGDYHEGDQSVDTGGGAYIGGNVSVDHGSKFVGRDDYSTTGLSGDEIAGLFETIYARIEVRQADPDAPRADIKETVEVIEAQVKQGDNADQKMLGVSLKSLKRMAPDIWEVVVATFANPALGIATVISKIMQQAKEQTT